MSNEKQDHEENNESTGDLSRRDFVAMSVAASIVAAAGSVSAADMPVTETMVDVKTADGTCDAAYIHPTTGSHPGVIIWPDAFGLRPAMRDIGKRIAAEGYSVLVVNPFYRATKAPGVDIAHFSFTSQDDMKKLQGLMGPLNAPGGIEKDAAAFVEFLDKQKEVNKSKKFGTQGYCMGGPLVVRTAAALPDRIGAGGSFHGGGLVTDQPTSPHLLAPKIKARMYFGVAANDDMRQPDAKDKLREAFGQKAEVEVYKSNHGWCVPDMPAPPNMPIYNKPEAEKAWTKLVALYKAGCV